MSEAENIEKVVAAIRKVPTKSLKIIELANAMPIRNGEFDYQELESRQPEIKLAVAEAERYGSGTLMAVDALIRLREAEPEEE